MYVSSERLLLKGFVEAVISDVKDAGRALRTFAWNLKHDETVRGLFSATVPDSSCARVRRVLVSHMEDEDDERRWKAKSRKESVENQATHNMQMTHVWNARHTPCSWANVYVTLKVLWINEKMWRVRCAVHTSCRLQQIATSCKRSDYKKKKKLVKVSLWAA